ncbi:MAG: hypothetical protein ACJ8G3_27440, partial [Burkholderiaceae bacterium]
MRADEGLPVSPMPQAAAAVAHYLDRLGLAPAARAAVEARITLDPDATEKEAMAGLHHALAAEAA